MRYSEFNIIEFRNIKNVKIKVKEGLNPIIGINDSGKSSILEAIKTFYELLSFDENAKSTTFEDLSISAVLGDVTLSDICKYFDLSIFSELDRKIICTEQYVLVLVQKYEKGKNPFTQLCLFKSRKDYQGYEINPEKPEFQPIKTRTLIDGFGVNVFPSIHNYNDFSVKPISIINHNPTTGENFNGDLWNKCYWGIGEGDLMGTIFSGFSSENVPRPQTRQNALDKYGELLTVAFRDFSKELSHGGELISFKATFHSDNKEPYIEIKGVESGKDFALSERSTGFMWVYNLMLWTKFNPTIANPLIKKKDLFLLDEPETHLHESMQRKLAQFLGEFSKTNDVIMATHSHRLVKPSEYLRLQNVYVAKKINVEEKSETETIIKLEKYGNISNDSDKQENSTHNALMPIYTALNLDEFSELAYGKNIILVEGPMDRYALRLFCKLEDSFSVWVTTGTGNIPTNSLTLHEKDYNFMVLTDYDDAGIKAIRATKNSLNGEYSDRWITKRIKNYNNFCQLSFDKQNGEKIEEDEKVTLEKVFESDLGDIIDSTFKYFDIIKESGWTSKRNFGLALETLFYEDKDRALTQKIMEKFSDKTNTNIELIRKGIYKSFCIDEEDDQKP